VRWLVSAFVLFLRWLPRRPRMRRRPRIVAEGTPSPAAELVVAALLIAAAVAATAFSVIYGLDRVFHGDTQLLGLSIGLAFVFLAAALIVVAKKLVVSEQLEEEYTLAHPLEQEEIVQIVAESGSRFTRKRLLVAGAGAAGTALGAALVTPLVSLGPFFDMHPFYETPWRRGRVLVDEHGRPWKAAAIEPETFYTAYPQGADRENIGSPVVVVRLDPSSLDLPPERSNWAPQGIVAYSKICTHAGCAIALYRKPRFPEYEPGPALVCPCHYSTFDPASGGHVLFGPAGRPLPQLPLVIDAAGTLRAGGNFSGAVGPSWWGVRLKGPA
jgi:ubiquinol-cytochrome c reductase iron-sulfur subunit